MTFLHELCQPEICERNGLNTVAISVFSTPFILRPKKCEIISSQGMTSEESDSAYMAAAAAGISILILCCIVLYWIGLDCMYFVAYTEYLDNKLTLFCVLCIYICVTIQQEVRLWKIY